MTKTFKRKRASKFTNMPLAANPAFRQAVIVVLVVYAIFFVGKLVSTLSVHPLFPFQMQDVNWTGDWLMTTVADYYGVALPLCAIILATEDSVFVGIAWSAGVLLLGSAVACAYVVRRAAFQSGASIALADDYSRM